MKNNNKRNRSVLTGEAGALPATSLDQRRRLRRGARRVQGRPAWCGGGGGGLQWRRRRRRPAGELLQLEHRRPAPEKMVTSASSCGRHRRRKASGKSRGARGGRGESGGRFLHPSRVQETATHLSGFRPAGGRWRRHREAAAAAAGEAWGRRRRSKEDDRASRSAFHGPEQDLVQSTPYCEG